jgi:hypothetical protein
VGQAQIEGVGGDALGVISHLPGGMLQLLTNNSNGLVVRFHSNPMYILTYDVSVSMLGGY